MTFLFGQSAIETKPKVRPPMTNRQQNQKWLALAPHVKKHFDTGNKSLKDIAFDLAWADYKNSLKKKDKP